MSDKHTNAIDKASKEANKGTKRKVTFSDNDVIVRIDSRGTIVIAVFEDMRLFNSLLKFCERQYGVTRSTPPGEWFGTIIC